MLYYEKRLRNFHSKMYGFVNRSVFIQKWKFQVSTLSGFRIMIQNVHVQFLFINSIFAMDVDKINIATFYGPSKYLTQFWIFAPYVLLFSDTLN